MFGQIPWAEPPICPSWWLWPLCVVHDLKMSLSAEIIERFRSSHQRWLMATYPHKNRNTQHLPLDLSHICHQLSHQQICEYVQTQKYIYTNKHKYAHTLKHTLQRIYQETQRSASGPLGDPGSWLNWPTVAAKPRFLPPKTLPAYRLVKISLSFLRVCIYKMIH